MIVLVMAVISLSFQTVGQAKADPVNISRGYQARQNLEVGSLVSQDPANNQSVVLADSSNVNNLIGVVISQNSSNISVTTNQSNVEVGTSGTYGVEVSDINGSINTGDKLTASPIEGFAMKATTSTRIIGTAQANFNSKTTGAISKTIAGKDGKSININIGSLPVLVTAEYWPGPQATGFLASVLGPVQNLLSSASKKPVSQLKALICVIIIAVSLIISIVILMVAMLASVKSIGRNPLARRSITGHLIFDIIIVITIIGTGFLAAYLIAVG